MKTLHKNTGFTIVELLISTTILSVILVSASFILVQVGRLYYKGVITARTQEASRNIIESIARPTQLEGSRFEGPTNVGDWTVLCVGNQRFSYQVGVLASEAQPVFFRDKIVDRSSCSSAATASTPGVESLLSNNMQIVELEPSPPNPDGMITIRVIVSYGRDIQNDGSRYFCTGQASSSQWCAVAAYSTSIYPRVGI